MERQHQPATASRQNCPVLNFGTTYLPGDGQPSHPEQDFRSHITDLAKCLPNCFQDLVMNTSFNWIHHVGVWPHVCIMQYSMPKTRITAGTASKQRHYCERQWGPLRGPAISEGQMTFDVGSQKKWNRNMKYVSKNQGKPKRIVMWFPCFEVVWLYHIGRIFVVLAEVESHPRWKDQPQLLGHNCHPGWLATAIPRIIFLGTTVSTQNSKHLEDIQFQSW